MASSSQGAEASESLQASRCLSIQSMPGAAPPQGPSRQTPQQGGPIAAAALQDLLRTLRSPSSPQQQQQVLRILRANPQLMSAFIKWRTAKYQANQPAPPGPLPGSMQLVPHGPPFMQAVPPGQWPGGPQGPMQSTLSLQQQQQQQQVPPQQQPPPQGLDDDSNGQGAEVSKSLQESRRLSIQRCIQSLVHACQCRNANCSLPSCQKMKRVVQHTKGCKRKTNGGCPICKQLIALCCYHAKHCQENKCPVPFCLNIKYKLRQQQLQHRLQQAQMLRRRMASMQGRRRNLKQG